MSSPACHLLGGDTAAAAGWVGFDLPPCSAWTLLVLADEDGRTGLSPFEPPRSILGVLMAEAHLWQHAAAAFIKLSSLDETTIVRVLGKHASPAALVVTSPHAALDECVAALRTYRAGLGKVALQRRYGRIARVPDPVPLASLLDESQPPQADDLSTLLDASAGLQIWRFAGGWGLHAILSGDIEVWRERFGVGAHAFRQLFARRPSERPPSSA